MLSESIARGFCDLVGLNRRDANLFCGELLTGLGYTIAINIVVSFGPGPYDLGFTLALLGLFAIWARFIVVPANSGNDPLPSGVDLAFGAMGGVIFGAMGLGLHWAGVE